MGYIITEDQSFITEFVTKKIKGVRSKTKLVELWKKELTTIYRYHKIENEEKINENCYRTRVGYVNVKSVIKTVTKYRELISETYSNHKSYEKAVDWMIYKGVYKLVKNDKGKLVKTKTEQKRGIVSITDKMRIFESENNNEKIKTRGRNKDKIEDVDGLVTKINRLENSTDWYNVLIWLAYATGRRMIEIVSTAEFKKCKENEYNAWFCGQAKTRNNEFISVKYKIPLLAPFKQVKEAMKYLRSTDKIQSTIGKSRESINKLLSSHVNFHTKKHTKEHAAKFSFHTLRAMYALLCVGTLKPSSMYQTDFVSDILGHDLSGKSASDKASKLYQLYELNGHENTSNHMLRNITYSYERKE